MLIKGLFRCVTSYAFSIFLVSGLLVTSQNSAQAEDCPNNDLSSVFFEEYYPGIKWDNSNPPRTITWTTEVTSIEGIPISRKLTSQESDWLDIAFRSWDEALDTVNFQRKSSAAGVDVQVGMVPIQNNGYWTVKEVGVFRASGTIQLSSSSPFLNTKSGFIETAQSEIGNLLGLGDIRGSVDVDSVMKDPDTPPYGSFPLSDYDIDLIRQFYGESTCHSSWSQSLKDLKAQAKSAAEIEKAAEEAKLAQAAQAAQAKADAQSKSSAEAKAAEEAAADKAREEKLRAEIAAQKATKKSTITCVKGKTVKKVTGINPKCPSGYKKK